MTSLLILAFAGCPDKGVDSATTPADDTEPLDCENQLVSCDIQAPCSYGDGPFESCPSGELGVECSDWLFEGEYFQVGLFCLTAAEYVAQVEACHAESDCRVTAEGELTSFACSHWEWCE